MQASLTPGQLAALQLLARRLDVEASEWINLADARALQALHLATHSGRGWVISEAGRQALRSLADRPAG